MFGEKHIAYLFPGQGSQVVGMGSALYQESPGARAIFDQADETLGFALSHLSFQGLEEELRQTVNVQPAVPVIGNCTGEPLNDVAAIRDELMAQLYTCVQWSKSVEYMADNGIGTFVEIGPGAVLTGLTKRIAKDVPAFSVADVASARTFAGRFVENDGVLRAVEVSSAGATHPVGGIPARVSGQVGIADPASRSTGRIVGR